MTAGMTPAVEFDRVSIVFGDRPDIALPMMDQGKTRAEVQAACGQVLGVHDCSLTVGKGEILVLMGLSGSGKSTLLRGVNALNPVVRGEVRVLDGDKMVSVTKADPATLRRLRLTNIAMVFQAFGLLPWRTVRENVGLGLELAGQTPDQRRDKVDVQLALVNLTQWADRKVGELSGGMQQRVGLARAFVTQAPILLMDEPFSAVDPVVRDELQAEILRLQAELRKTIVFVTHDIDEAIKLGDAVAVFGRGGALQQYAPPQRLLTNPANEFVSEFIGADRGYRSLQFFTSADLALQPIHAVTEGGIDALHLVEDEWYLVLREDGSPVGWVDAPGTERHRNGGSLYDSVTAGGSLFHPESTLRAALDAALSSPSGIGVSVDESGKVLGGVLADDVIDALEDHRRAGAALDDHRRAGA